MLPFKTATSAGFIDRNFDEIAERAARLDDRIVPISLEALARAALELCKEERTIISVGNGAKDITRYWPSDMPICELPVSTVFNSRNRETRVLKAAPLELGDSPRYLVDDVAVSGLTLAVARRALRPNREDDTAIVGMAYRSRQMRRRIGATLQSPLTYSQTGGGKPPVNSLATLAANRALRTEYARRYFGCETTLDEILEAYEGENS